MTPTQKLAETRARIATWRAVTPRGRREQIKIDELSAVQVALERQLGIAGTCLTCGHAIELDPVAVEVDRALGSV